MKTPVTGRSTCKCSCVLPDGVCSFLRSEDSTTCSRGESSAAVWHPSETHKLQFEHLCWSHAVVNRCAGVCGGVRGTLCETASRLEHETASERPRHPRLCSEKKSRYLPENTHRNRSSSFYRDGQLFERDRHAVLRDGRMQTWTCRCTPRTPQP